MQKSKQLFLVERLLLLSPATKHLPAKHPAYANVIGPITPDVTLVAGQILANVLELLCYAHNPNLFC